MDLESATEPPSAANVRQFGLAMLIGFGGLGALFWWTGRAPELGWGWSGSGRQSAACACWAAGAAFAAISWASVTAGRRLRAVWMAVSTVLGGFMTAVLLTLLYFLFLPFFAWIRWRDPLRTRLHRDGSYWENPSTHEPTLERMRKPF